MSDLGGGWGERLLWPATIALSLAAHGAGALMMMQAPAATPTHEGEVAQEPLVVMLMAAPMEEPLPEPEPEPVKETPLKAAPEPAPKQVDVERPKPETPKKPRKKERDKTAEKRKQPKAQATASAATAPKATKGGNKRWASQVRSKIERRKRFPAGGASGTVALAMSISGSGALNSVSVAGSSGNAALDRAALDAVRRAAPFPPAPEGGGPFQLRLRMSFKAR